MRCSRNHAHDALVASAVVGDLLQRHKQDYGSVEQHYRRAIRIDPGHADAHYNLGVLLENKADYGGAEQH